MVFDYIDEVEYYANIYLIAKIVQTANSRQVHSFNRILSNKNLYFCDNTYIYGIHVEVDGAKRTVFRVRFDDIIITIHNYNVISITIGGKLFHKEKNMFCLKTINTLNCRNILKTTVPVLHYDLMSLNVFLNIGCIINNFFILHSYRSYLQIWFLEDNVGSHFPINIVSPSKSIVTHLSGERSFISCPFL